MKRTHGCGALRSEHVGQRVTLNGWARTVRDHGGLIFIDLWDRSGIVQVVFNPEHAGAAAELARDVRSEFVLAVEGEVAARPTGTVNPHLLTGEIEVHGHHLEILNTAKTPPFSVADPGDVDETLRLKHRYLDLRTPRMQRNLHLRHQMARETREYLSEQGFWEVETPLLLRSTPEGARDYLVPARTRPGYFYALPQSPQLMKQTLMVAGVERVFQLARCLRDEDLRADRQPEFTQIDLEMSFVDEDDVLALSEGLTQRLFRAVRGEEITLPLPRLTYREAMDRYGSDKPDTRFGLELVDVTSCLAQTGFKVFADLLATGGTIRGLNAKGCAHFSRQDLNDLTRRAAEFGAKGLVTMQLTADGVKSNILKHLTEQEQQALATALSGETGDLLLLVADQPEAALRALGRLRLELGRQLELISEHDFHLLWVVDFPLFALDDATGAPTPMHHPFSCPKPEDVDLIETDPLRVHGRMYDLVINGQEVAGGSIRIHRRDLQERVFQAIRITPEEVQRRFGFLAEALEYGAPPHGGIAFGFDRLVAIFAGEDSIRDVIAFPKTAQASDPLTGAPAAVDPEQLAELCLQVTVVEEEEKPS